LYQQNRTEGLSVFHESTVILILRSPYLSYDLNLIHAIELSYIYHDWFNFIDQIGETIADKAFGKPLPSIRVEEPTVKMAFSINTSPFVGREVCLLNNDPELSESHSFNKYFVVFFLFLSLWTFTQLRWSGKWQQYASPQQP